MKIKKRVMAYSISLMLVIMAMIVAYSFIMLPRLYVSDMNKKIEDELKTINEELLDGKGIRQKTSANMSVYGTILDMDKPFIRLYSSMGNIEIDIKDKNMRDIYMKNISKISKFKDKDDFKKSDFKFEGMDSLGMDFSKKVKDKVSIKVYDDKGVLSYDSDKNYSRDFDNGMFSDDSSGKNYSADYDVVDDDTMMVTSRYKDSDIEYQMKQLFTKKNNKLYITYAQSIIPGIEQILPTIYSSIPMMIGFLALLFVGISALFTKSLSDPINDLSRRTSSVRDISRYKEGTVVIDRPDEIGDLSRDIDRLYTKIKEQYNSLEDENNKKRLMMRGASHQLKTPIAGAMLIVDGMINGVGKLKDNTEYLEKLKERLVSMQMIVERLLRIEENSGVILEKVDIRDIFDGVLSRYDDKNIDVNISGHSTWDVDVDLFEEIVDNLVSNCYHHTEKTSKGEISVKIEEERATIYNRIASIPDSILGNVTEAFVSKSGEKGHGLGLYLARERLKSMGMGITVENIDDGVRVRINRTDK